MRTKFCTYKYAQKGVVNVTADKEVVAINVHEKVVCSCKIKVVVLYTLKYCNIRCVLKYGSSEYSQTSCCRCRRICKCEIQ